jgi:maleate isomerase
MPQHRIGLIVPSSNTTVETEMPRLLASHPDATFTFHSSRMRMTKVSPEGLAAMNAQRERCVDEIDDAGVEVILYACLVALMAAGAGEHERVEAAIADQAGPGIAVRSSAGALIEALAALEAKRIALVTPYMRPLAEKVVAYLTAYGLEIADYRALEVEDNADVARIPGERIMAAARSLDLEGVDAVVLSACVQMPSLSIVETAEAELGVPIVTAATAGAYSILEALDLPVALRGGGALLRRDEVALATATGASSANRPAA